MMAYNPLARLGWLALLAYLCLWFGPLDFRPLLKADESRYALISLEMFQSGDWLTPHLNGVKYFEKPPLQYWATALAYEVFGVHEWTARLWTALTGFTTLLAVFFTGRRVFGREAGLLAAVSLGSTLYMLLMGQMNALDMGLTCFLTLSLCGLLLAQSEPASAGRWMALTWANLALAVLSKGLVALVLCGGTLVLYTLVTRDARPWRQGHWLMGIPLFLLIASPWFILVNQANPEFFDFFFIHEHFERFLTKAHRRYQPAWYFIPVLLVALLPWTAGYLKSLVTAWQRDNRAAFRPRTLLTVWAVLVFAFFSASSSKLPSYVLPMAPALALLFGDMAWRHAPSRGGLILAGLLGLTLLILPPVAAQLPSMQGDNPEFPAYVPWLMGAGVFMTLGSLAAARLARQRENMSAWLALAAGAALAWGLVVNGNKVFAPAVSAASLMTAAAAHIPADATVYSVQLFDQSIPFYLGRPVILVSTQDELEFGLKQAPEKWVPTMEAFRQRWEHDTTTFAVMRKDTYADLRRQGWPFEILAQDATRVMARHPDRSPTHAR